MSIEGLMLDLGMNVDMTEFEKNCYGMAEQDIRQEYMESLTAKLSGLEMVVMGILSDCQELQSRQLGISNHDETIRKQLNVAKFILSEMMQNKMENV
ncbi:MAG: hypothetical protein ACO3EE_07730 [Flavobacteriales bacterium]